MGLDIIASMAIGRTIAAVKVANPKAYAGFKATIGIAAAALTRLCKVLEDDQIEPGEIDAIVKEVQDTGAGRLVVGLVMGAMSKIR
jgi:hypothetical protein